MQISIILSVRVRDSTRGYVRLGVFRGVQEQSIAVALLKSANVFMAARHFEV